MPRYLFAWRILFLVRMGIDTLPLQVWQAQQSSQINCVSAETLLKAYSAGNLLKLPKHSMLPNDERFTSRQPGVQIYQSLKVLAISISLIACPVLFNLLTPKKVLYRLVS